MELDKRILEGKKPLDCFDIDKAEQFIGKKGYFCDHISGFTDISNLSESVLRDITPDENDCEVYKTNCTSWEYFLPEEWVKEPEKKYRPFTLDEFVNQYSLGDEVIMRSKDSFTNRHVLFTEYEEGKSRDDVRLGQYWYTFMILFNSYELYIDGEWKPFGVEE